MQDREETSSVEVTEHDPNKDRTRLISCSATPGVGSCDWTLSSSDRTLSEAVTGHTGDTVHRHGNVFSVTGRSGTGRPDARSTMSDRFQRGSKAAPVRPDASGR